MRNLLFIVVSICVFSFQNQAFSLALPSNGAFKKVKSGEVLISILKDHGWKQEHIAEVLRHSQAKSFKLYPKMEYFVGTEPNQIIFFEKESDYALTLKRQNANAEITYEKVAYRTEVFSVAGKVVGSLQASLMAKVPSTSVAQKFMNAFTLDHNLHKSIQRNAAYSLSYEKKYLGKRFIKYGEVLRASIEIGGKIHERDFVRFSNGGAFINPLDISKKPLYSPVAYLNISSVFQPRRRHPITRRVIPHMGIDFELPVGEPVYNVKDGRVLRTGRNRAAGNYIVIRHTNGLESYYNHLSETFVKSGQRLRAGEKIGAIGCTGYCTKAHLHFAVKKSGRFTNPAQYLKPYPYHKRERVQAYRTSLSKN